MAQATLTAFDYDLVERVDEAGEAVLRPGAVDVFPAGAASPVRLELENGRIATIRRFDVADQLTTVNMPSTLFLPRASSCLSEAAELVRPLLPECKLATLFDLMPDAALAVTDSFEQRVQDWLDLVQDGYRMALNVMRAGLPPPRPHRLYLRHQEIGAVIAERQPARVTIANEPAEPAMTLAVGVRRAAALRADDLAMIVCAGRRRARPWARRSAMSSSGCAARTSNCGWSATFPSSGCLVRSRSEQYRSRLRVASEGNSGQPLERGLIAECAGHILRSGQRTPGPPRLQFVSDSKENKCANISW